MTTKLLMPKELSPHEIDRMFQLMLAHYDGMRRASFEQDLFDKDRVIVLEAEGGIIGFSTQKFITYQGVRAVFSGDTIIDRAHWGTQALSRAFAQHFFDHPEGPLYWFLISKGFKTYKYLPTFFQEFYPRYDRPTPPAVQSLLDGFGETLYPSEYRKDTGVITYRGDKDRLKPELQELSVREQDPHYSFFITENPGYANGEDLACLTLLTRKNLRRGAERILFGSSV